MKIVLIVYVISWLIVLGAAVVRLIINGWKFFKQFPWYYYLRLFALAPFCILFIVIPLALKNCLKKSKRKAKSDADGKAEEIDIVDSDYGNWFK